MGGILNYAVDIELAAMIYIPSFLKIGSGIQKLMLGGGGIHGDRRHGCLISLFEFFQIKESRLKQLCTFPGQCIYLCHVIARRSGNYFCMQH
jgi:hypothetical protein